MSDTPKSGNTSALSKAYEHLLEKLLQKTREGEILAHHFVDEFKQDAAAIYDLSADEMVLLEQYIKRDLADAAHYLQHSGDELKSWLGFDLHLIEQAFWEKFSAAADRTTTELLQLKQTAERVGYRTGEIIGIGTLVCDQCGEKLQFHKPGHIPPCAQCHATQFHRVNG